jgi:beta-1,2-mannobiose phosphorylase / 1,2-beta-oligomannan phosphorylase
MLTVTKHGVLIEPTSHQFENHGVFNPACISVNGEIHLLYRATTKENYSTIGYCLLESPIKIAIRNEKPLLIPLNKNEAHGIEDPRIVNIDGTYILSYTAYDGSNALGAMATSKDLKTFDRHGIITPQLTYKEFQLCIDSNEGLKKKYLRFVKLLYDRGGLDAAHKLFIWDKDVVFFPRKINGKFAFLHRIYPDIQIVYFNDLQEISDGFWRDYLFNIKDHTMMESKMPFEASYLGGGCPPIETDHGWLIIYHGVEDTHEGYVYHAGAALFEIDNPTIEIGRLKRPLFSPDQDWEKSGVVNNVVFPTGTILIDDILYIYYGAADMKVGVASVNINELIKEIKN